MLSARIKCFALMGMLTAAAAGDATAQGLDLGALFRLPSNIDALSKMGTAMNATVPKGFDAAEEDYFRRQIARGKTPEQAAVWVKTPEGRRYVASQRYFNGYKACASADPATHDAIVAKSNAIIAGTEKPQNFPCKK